MTEPTVADQTPAADTVTWLELGNTAPVQTLNDDEGGSARVPLADNRVTRIEFGRDASLGEMFTNVTDPRGPWATVSDAAPSWVASNNQQLQFLLAANWKCAEGHPADLEETHYTFNGPPGVDYTTGLGLEGAEAPVVAPGQGGAANLPLEGEVLPPAPGTTDGTV